MTFKEKKTFFTIIIPTRERSDTLMYTLKNALSQDYDQFQVLVSDNASEDDTREKVSSINDSRLKYVNTGRRVSMSENWEFALNHVNMGWITVLGDDDAILPGTLGKVNNIINKTGTSAIRSNGCAYRWPGFDGSNYGSLSISLKRGYETRDSGEMLQKVLDGKIYYNELPMLYNGGFISFDLVKQAKSVTKKFFMSMTPDVYSAMVFSLLTKSYIYSHEPLAINGASLHSGGTAGFEHVKQKRSYDPVEKFWSEQNIPFHEDLPLLKNGRGVRSIQITIYEAFLQAERFHAAKSVKTNLAQQLKLAILKSGPYHLEILEWAILISQRHKLNLSIRYTSLFWFNLLTTIYNRIKIAIHTFKMRGSPSNPLMNVNDASLVADAFKEIRPSIFSRAMHHFYNLIKKGLPI
jgi:glycosyltransferase involved in cell wall biosynthesis